MSINDRHVQGLVRSSVRRFISHIQDPIVHREMLRAYESWRRDGYAGKLTPPPLSASDEAPLRTGVSSHSVYGAPQPFPVAQLYGLPGDKAVELVVDWLIQQDTPRGRDPTPFAELPVPEQHRYRQEALKHPLYVNRPQPFSAGGSEGDRFVGKTLEQVAEMAAHEGS